MIKSSRIFPIRFYDNFFDQNRFDHSLDKGYADRPNEHLFFPTNELPFFQLTRKSSLNNATQLFLRSTCEDYKSFYSNSFGTRPSKFYKQIPEGADIFSEQAALDFYLELPEFGVVYDDGISPPSGMIIQITEFSCNKLKTISTLTSPPYYNPVTPVWPQLSFFIQDTISKYHFRIIIDRFKPAIGSSVKICLYNNSIKFGEIDSAGVFDFNFTSGATTIVVVYQDYTFGDEIDISYMQAEINKFDTISEDSLQLDETAVKILPSKTGNDIITYCEANQNYPVKEGSYYYVLFCEDEIYFSEVFTIKPILEMQSYFKLKWLNSCDINDDIIYNSTSLTCNFYNKIYLDTVFFSPEYDTSEQEQENGDGDKKTTFRRWQKLINLDIQKCPPYLSDALSAVFLHDTITLTDPINNYQNTFNTEYQVLKSSSDVTDSLNGFFQSVKLSFVLAERLTQTNCCSSTIIPCVYPYKYYAFEDCGVGNDYSLILSGTPTEGDGLTNCTTSELVDVLPSDYILFDGDGCFYSLVKDSDGIWVAERIMPGIVSVNVGSPTYAVAVTVIPYTWAELKYNKNGAGWITASVAHSDANGNCTLTFLSGLLTGATDFKLMVDMKTIVCLMASSEVYDVI